MNLTRDFLGQNGIKPGFRRTSDINPGPLTIAELKEKSRIDRMEDFATGKMDLATPETLEERKGAGIWGAALALGIGVILIFN